MRTRVLTVSLAVLALAACDEIVGPDQNGLAPEEVAELSNALIQDGLAETGDTSGTASASTAFDQAGAGGADTLTMEFTRTHDCAFGGQVTMAGTRERVRDRETRSGSMDFTATRTFTDCARPLDADLTITLNGEVTMTAHREWEGGAWNGTQELTILGSIDWQIDDGREGTCEIDIQATFDPSTRTRTVTGEACNEDLGRLGGWSFGPVAGGPHHGGRHGPHHGRS